MITLLKHLRNYLSAGLIGALIGLISFPLLTRALSVEDYGLLGLVTATVTVFASFSKMGLQNSVLRFYSDAKVKNRQEVLNLLNTVAGAIVLFSIVGLGLWLASIVYVIPYIHKSYDLTKLFLIAAAIVPIKVAHSLLSNLLMADQRSGVVGTVSVSEKIFRLICLAVFVYSIGLSAESTLFVIVASELIFIIILFYQCQPYLKGVRPIIQFATLTPLLAYGVPAMMGELAWVLLQTGDRYVIQAYLGAVPLGHYAAVANICMYLEWVLILSLQSAVVPHYLKLYAEQGREKTLSFLNNLFDLYVVISIGVFVVFCVVAPKLVILLAGERYRDGLVVIPWFAAGYILVGAITIAGAGVFIDKRTKILVKWTIIAFIVNLILNFLAVPSYGLIAAAVSTFVAMGVRSIGVYRDASKTLRVTMPWRSLFFSVGCVVPAYIAGSLVHIGNLFVDFLLAGAITGLVYFGLMLAVNPAARTMCLGLYLKFVSKSSVQGS